MLKYHSVLLGETTFKSMADDIILRAEFQKLFFTTKKNIRDLKY